MALNDLTDRSAVREAIAEFDRIGRNAFLQKYGFGRAQDYFLQFNMEAYDSKAIAGAALGYQHGLPAQHDEFSGGDATVATRLERLGFTVTRPGDTGWRTPVGTVTTRSHIKEQYGGTIFGGIEPSRTTPNILIYTDPQQGALSGYNYDGWDANDRNAFYYTGEGRRGDQELKDGNRAVLDHAESGRTIRLFEAADDKKRVGGKLQRYVGAFRVDDAAPYRFASAPGADGTPRQVIVFRLLREGTAPLAVEPSPPVPAATPLAQHHGELEDPTEVEDGQPEVRDGDAPPPFGDVELVPSEQNTVVEYETTPRTGTLARKAEATLVAQFESWLRSQGHDIQRVRIKVPGEPHSLVTDSYDVTTGTLYEAKSGVDRATVRLGVGQALDYLRFLPGATGALLLPSLPSRDLQNLISSCGLGLAYRELGKWVIARSSTTTQRSATAE